MKGKGAGGAVCSGLGGGLATRKIPSQKIPAYRKEFLGALPSQVLRPLYAAADARRSLRARCAYYAAAKREVGKYEEDESIWVDSVDERLERRGVELIDRNNEDECQAFLADIGRATLEKRHKRETAIAAAKLQLELIARDLGLVDGN